MDVETAIQAFAGAGNDLPREAMRWTLDHWEEAAPGLLAVLERFADGSDRSDDAANAAFFILHLAGERRETRAFATLCRLAKEPEAIEAVLGDGIGTTLKGILIGTYDGDLDALKGLIELIEAEGADGFVRSDAFEVLAYLTATGRIPRQETEAYLRRLYGTLLPQGESMAWYGWSAAIALLGLEPMADLVLEAFRRGLIDPTVTTPDLFRQDLDRTLRDPAGMAGFEHDRTAPLHDAVGELSGWYGFSEEAKRAEAKRAAREAAGPDPREPLAPAVNPFKGVGRNDPCPCGSGRKFKKCCLPLVSSAGLP